MTPSSAELSRLTREEKLALLRRLAEEQEPAARAVLGPAPDGPLPGEERAPRRHPVTFAQRRLWFLDRLEPGGSHNTIFRVLRLYGPLDRAALAAALARIAARHGALRTRFEEIDGEPVQVVEPAALAAPRLSRVDLSGLGGGSGQVARQERERRLAALARDEAARPFDLERAPLVRFTLVELGGGRVGDQVGDPAEGEAALLIALHHIVADGWSLGILLRELSALYGAAVTEGSLDAADLPALATTYGAHARSQRERLSGEELARELELWRERLADAPTVLDLPSDRPRPALESFRGAIEPFALAPDTVAGVRALARSERATPFMVLLAAFAAVLARWAGRDDLLLGTPVAGRTRSELEPLIGFFANTLVLRADLRGGPGFRELLRRVRAHALVAFGHQEMPFERLVEELEDERDLSRNPLFQVMFALQNMPATSLGLEGLAVEQIPVERGLAKVDLTLDLVEPAGSPGWEAALRGYLEYNTDLFDRSTARRLVGAFRRIVDAAVRDPERPVGRLPMLAPAERHALTVEWQGAPGPGRPGSGRSAPPPVHQTILRRAAADPERTAVEAGGVRWSYGELDRASARVASRLRELGVGVEDRVGVLATRSAETIAGFLGVLRAGGAYVPLDPEYPDERLAFMASDAGVRAILVGEGLDARAGRVAPEAARRVPLGLCKGAGTLSEEAPCKGAGTVSASGEVAPEAAAYVLYTSGTTGRPKGVVVSHGALANHAAAVTAAYALAPDDRVLQFASVSFDIAGEEIYPTLARGAALVLRTPELSLEPRGLVRFVAERRLTVINIPTPLWHEWCRELERPRQGPDQNPLLPPEALRLVIVGTEGALPERLRAWSEALGRSGRDAPRWINAYGPTEATVTSTLHRVRPHEVEDGAARIPIGRPVAGLTAHVLDGRLEPVPVGSAGELHLGGAGIARGYLGRPAATAGVFVPDPFAPLRGSGGGRLYRTGDLARVRPDGAIEFLGRTDDQVKIRGFRVELGEVESALAAHPDVREVAVLAVEAAPGDRRLAAFVVGGEAPAPTPAPSATSLREWLAERLPAYMVPAAFVALPELPLTPAGKVDRERLPTPGPADWAGLAAGRGPRVPPRTPVEAMLAEIWSEVLEAGRIGVHDDFFALGGHSLLATRVLSRVRDRLGVELPLRAVFEASTVAELAVRVAASGDDGASSAGRAPVLPPIAALPRRDPAGDGVVVEAPLSFAQQRLWFLDRLEPGRAIYNVPAAVRLETGGAPLDLEALEGALRAIVHRHGALRTRFELPEGGAAEPVQVVRATAPAPFRRHDLTALSRSAAEAEAGRLGALEAGAPFDLERGPLVRFALVSLPRRGPDAGSGAGPEAGPPAEHRLLVTFHHAVADGWSIDLFLRELAQGYETRAARAPAAPAAADPLPELPVQYADYAAWQRSVLRGETLEGLLAFWRETLDGAPRVLDVPADRPRPPVPSYRGGRCYFRIGPAVTDALRHVARDARASRFMTLLAAWQALLARRCGVADLLMGSPVAGRGRAELEGLIGVFVNTLVLRGRVAPDAPFRAHLERVRETCLDAFGHAELPFERLVEELQPERSLAHNPLFQVMFSYQSSGLVSGPAPDGPPSAGSAAALRPILLSNYNGTARVDLALDLWEDPRADGTGLAGYVEYASDLFDRSTAERLTAGFRILLGAAARDPERPVAGLPLLSRAERHQALVEWSATGRPIPAGATLHGLVRERIRATPEAEALVFGEPGKPGEPGVGGGERLTYAELGRRVEILARHLRRLGVGPETLVGLFVERSARMVVGLLGVLEAGGAYVPLDPSFPAERLASMVASMVDSSDLPVLLTEEALVGRLPAAAGRRVVRLDADWPQLEARLEADPRLGTPLPAVDPDQLAYVIFTSGSTGTPKGVQIPHRSAVNFLRSMAREPGLGPGDTLLALTTLSFDIALLELLLPLTVSARVVVAGSDEVRAADELAARIAEVAPTVVQATPATWRNLLEVAGSGAGGADRILPPPGKVLCGGEALPRDLADRLLAALRPPGGAPGELWNLYGPTETTVWSGALRLEPGDGPVPVGGPIDNTSLHVLDPLDPEGGPAGIGVPGELAIGGAGLARGYLGRPARTAERFRPDPFAGARSPGGARMYRTGDLVRRRADGRIEFLGRLDHQVKIRGYRIEPGEIETVLLRHPAVLRAAVVAREDGPGGRRLVAYAVLDGGPERAPAVSELRAALEASLPGYMVPSAFVVLDALPLTPNGKVDRRALPAPGDDRPELAGAFVAPRTAVEEELAGIWREVLGVERIGIGDDFFALGGHSLLATQVMTRVEETFGQEAPVRLLFEAPTIEGLAGRLVDSGLDGMDQEALARALDDIENLTEDELEALLAPGGPVDGTG